MSGSVPGLVMTENAMHLLKPGHTPTELPSAMEQQVLRVLRKVEDRYGTSILTSTLIESITMQHILAQLPKMNSRVQAQDVISDDSNNNVLNIVHRQLQAITINMDALFPVETQDANSQDNQKSRT